MQGSTVHAIPDDVDYDCDDSKYGKDQSISCGVEGIGTRERAEGQVQTGTKHV